MDIGSKGLAEVNLTIPQGTSLEFDITHTDEGGNAVDHTGSTIAMAFQTRDGKVTRDLSACCTGTSTGVSVAIPASATGDLPLGKMVWDLIATMTSGDVVRVCYGSVSVVDTYALDE